MIQEIRIRNYMSFRDEVKLSFEAVSEDSFEIESQSVEVANGVRLLRFIALYGANASGKSNLLKVFDLLHCIFYDGDLPNSGFYFAFDEQSYKNPTQIDLVIWNNNNGKYIKCNYSLSFVIGQILKESFFIDDEKIFERNNIIKDNDIFADIFIDENKSGLNPEMIGYAKYSCTPSKSLINILYHINIPNKSDYLLTNSVWKFVENFAQSQSISVSNSKIKIEESQKDISFVLKVFKDINYDICEIKQVDSKYILGHKSLVGTYYLEQKDESTGTICFINTLSAMRGYINDSRAYLFRIDEPDNNLHTAWFRYFVNLFLENNNKERQMMIATHNAELLDWVNRFLRIDSIWFVEKDDELSSNLYSLADFDGLDEVHLFSKEYLNGNFGAVPNIN